MAEHVWWGVSVPQWYMDGETSPAGFDVLSFTLELDAAQLASRASAPAAGGGAAGGAAVGALPAALPRGRVFSPQDVLAVIGSLPWVDRRFDAGHAAPLFVHFHRASFLLVSSPQRRDGG